MSKQIVKKLSDEIKGKNRKENISLLEEMLSENVEKLSKNENFYHLPLNNIFSVISKVDFSEIEENDKIIEIIQTIIKNIIDKHNDEKETILILQNLNTETISFSSYEEIFSVLELITNCPFIVNFCNLYKEQKQLVVKDYEYELKQKEKEIEKLKQKNINKQETTNKTTVTKKFTPIKEINGVDEPDFLFKFILIGDSRVGKTNFLSRFVHDKFNPDSISTIGVEFSSKSIEIEGKIAKLQSWDTAGEERYRAITSAYYRGAIGALLLYDITDPNTFGNLKKWISEIHENADSSVVVMLVGNKLDLEEHRAVSTDEGAAFAKDNNFFFIETSGKDGTNVNETFIKLTTEIIHRLSENNKKYNY